MDHELQSSKNFAWNTISQAVIRIASFLLFIVMYRRLKDVGMGEYNFVLSFTSFWFIIVDFGIVGYLAREWSSKKNEFKDIESDFYIALLVRLIFFVVFFLPFLIINYFINSNVYASLILAAISILLSLFVSLIDAYYQASNLFRYVTIRQTLERVGVVIFGSIFVLIIPRVEMVFVAYIIGQIISIVYCYMFTSVYLKFNFNFNFNRAKFLIAKGVPFMFVVLFWNIYARVDMIMLKYMQGFQVVGWYGAAYKLLDLALLFPTVLLIPAVYPVLARMRHPNINSDDLHDFIDKILRILFSSGVILTLFFLLFAPVIIPIFFTSTFDNSILAVRILIFTQILSSMTIFFNYLLYTQEKEKISLYIIIVCGLINILLNLYLIPRYSLYGSAWATVIAETVNLLLFQHFVVWRKNIVQLRNMGLIIVFNMVILFIFRMQGQINNLWLGTLFLLINILLLFKMKLIKFDDIKLFLQPFKLKLASLRQ